MLPDYPNIKKKIQKKFVEAIKKKIQKDPLLSQIRTRLVNEGDVITSSSIDGYSENIELKSISAKLEITKEEVIKKGPDAFFNRVDEIAEEIAKQQAQSIFKKMGEVTKRTGQIVNAKSKPLSPQLILQMHACMYYHNDCGAFILVFRTSGGEETPRLHRKARKKRLYR